MKFTEAQYGRIFVLRLENGEIIHETVEKFAIDHSISSAVLTVIGGIDKGSRLIVGPERPGKKPIIPIEILLSSIHETAGIGTIFPDVDGNPVLHMHISCGRKKSSKTGCIRKGVVVWHILEIVILEIICPDAKRLKDDDTGFELLTI